jgi:oligosaccharide repeat unit polymerase
LATGLVGLLGLITGMRLGEWPVPRQLGNALPRRTFGLSLYLPMLVAAVVIAEVSARANQSTSGSYFTDALEAAQGGGTGATLYVVAYILIALLFVDALNDSNLRLRHWKLVFVFAAIVYIVVFQQLLLGNREVLGLIVALGALYITRVSRQQGAHTGDGEWKRLRRLIPIGVLVIAAFLAVGQLRYSDLPEYESDSSFIGAAVREVASGGTWTAVLLGNLGLANEHTGGTLRLLGGETYLDYLMSLPPGFITGPLGIERPLEAASGPGLWYYPLQWGGVHPVIVPFKNFGIWGVFVVLTFFGWLIARRDALNQTGTFWNRLFYGTFFVASFNWFWYGDMPFIRSLMAATILGVGFQVLLNIKKQLPSHRNRVTPVASF